MTVSETTDYIGNKIYENGTLKRILIDNGYIEENIYYFYIKDHLGNNRIVAKSNGTLVQATHYYPFGSSFAVATGASVQPYKYNNKELDTMHGLNWYDYSARYKDDWRFTTMDPLAEKYYSWSPYVYVMNNPLKYVDPTGMWTQIAGGYTTSDPQDIERFVNGHKSQQTNTQAKSEFKNPITPIVNSLKTAVQDIFFSNETTPDGEKYLKPKDLEPDYVAVSLLGTAIVGGGFGLDFTVGHVKGEGLFFNESFRAGDGFDISGSVAFTYAKYTGNGKPTATSLAGKAFYQNLGAGLITVGSFQDLSRETSLGGYNLGKYWVGGNVGISLGSKTFGGGSVGLSITSFPLYFNKNK